LISSILISIKKWAESDFGQNPMRTTNHLLAVIGKSGLITLWIPSGQFKRALNNNQQRSRA
jgi:hypothetical protein